ncbi:MAG: sigma-70 family RNA polymerase sigma factor [Planctomycetota bacterium]
MNEQQPTPNVSSVMADAKFVRRLAKCLLRDDARADDVAQDVVLAALEKPPPHGSNLRGWLTRVTQHLVSRSRREAARRTVRELVAARSERLPSALDSLVRLETFRFVVDAVRGLGEPYRSVVLLRFFEDLPRREIARRLGVPPATVTSRLQRALEQLRESLDRKHGGDRKSWCAALAPLAAGKSAWVVLERVAEKVALGVEAMSLPTKLSIVAAIVVVGAVAAWPFMAPEGDSSPAPAVVQSVPAAEEASQDAQAGPHAERELVVVPGRGAAEPRGFTKIGTEGCGSVRVRVALPDGSPVASESVRLQCWDRPIPVLELREALTDSNGTCTFDDVPAGGVTVFPNRQVGAPPSSQRGTVVAGEVLELSATLQPGVNVEGLVVDADGFAVAGATVWASSESPALSGCLLGGSILATTAADGTFTLQHMCPAQALAAWAEGHAPSRRVGIESCMETGQDGVDVVLSLRGAGGAVEGTVRNSAGEPVAGATVTMGNWSQFGELDADGVLTAPAPWRYLRTDATGFFRAEGLDPGAMPIFARAPETAQWESSVEIVACSTVRVASVLEIGATVTGVATTFNGEPVEDCFVSVTDRGEDNSLLSNVLIVSTTRSGPDGSFTIEHAAVGALCLFAQAMQPLQLITKDVVLHSGETTRWDVVFPPSGTITGRLVEEGGVPIGGWYLTAAAEDDEVGITTMPKTDAEGRFTFEGLSKGKHHLTVWGSDIGPPLGLPFTILHGVELSQGEQVFRLADEVMPSARLTGTVLDADGKAPGLGFRVRVTRWEENPQLRYYALQVDVDPETGHFTTNLIAPFTYKVDVYQQTVSKLDLGTHELAPDQVLDFGSVYLRE